MLTDTSPIQPLCDHLLFSGDDWYNVQHNVRKAIEQLSAVVHFQSRQIKELQLASDDNDRVSAQRKAESAQTEALARHVQALTDTSNALTTKQKATGDRVAALEKRISFEIGVPAAVDCGATPRAPSPWWAPVPHSDGAIFCPATPPTQRTRGTPMAERLAHCEHRLEQFCDAMAAVEDDHAAAVARLSTLEGKVASQLTCSATDLQALGQRLDARVASSIEALEVQHAKAYSAARQLSAEHCNARVNALSSEINAELADMKDQAIRTSQLQERVAALEVTSARVSTSAATLCSTKADVCAVEAMKCSLEATVSAAVDGMRAALVTRAAEIADSSEEAHKALAHAVAKQFGSCEDAVLATRSQLSDLQQAIFGSSSPNSTSATCKDLLSDASASDASIATQLARLATLLEAKCDKSTVVSLRESSAKTRAQLSASLDQLTDQMRTSVESAAAEARQAATAVLASVKQDVSDTIQGLRSRVSLLESTSAHCSALSAANGQAQLEPGGTHAEARVHQKLRKLEDAMARLSSRLTHELTGAHAMIANGLASAADAVEALQTGDLQELRARVESSIAEMGVVQGVVGALNSEVEQVSAAVEKCLSHEAMRECLEQAVSSTLAREAVSREQREQLRLQVWIEKIGDRLSEKISKCALEDGIQDVRSEFAHQLDAAVEKSRTLIDSVAVDVRGELASYEARLDTTLQVMQLRVHACESALAHVASLPEANGAKELEARLVTAVDALKDELQLKADRAAVQEELCRKLDVRTFLAAQATSKCADSLGRGDSIGSAAHVGPCSRQYSSANLFSPQETPYLGDAGSGRTAAGQPNLTHFTPLMSSPVSARRM